MHILFDARIHLNHITGMSRYIINLLREVTKDRSLNFTILINSELRQDDVLIQALQPLPNVKFERVNLPHIGPINYILLPKIIRKFKPDLYHYPHLDAPIVKGVATIATIHDANFKNGIKKYNDPWGMKTQYFKWALQNTVKKATKVLFVSEAMLNETCEITPTRYHFKFKVIYNGLEPGFLPEPAEKLSAVKQKFNLAKPFFLFVGQLREHKNIFRIVDAYKQLETEDIQLVIVGYGYNEKLLNLDHPGIKYLGMVSEEDLIALYQLSKCFVFPSLMEGFGLPIIEALSLGTQVITSNFGATKEVSGDVCTLVDPFSVASIKAAMSDHLNDNKIGDREKSLMISRAKEFNWEKSGAELIQLYRSIK